jgi:hypothetical protein
LAITKILPIRTTIERSIAYICNPDKTESCLFVSAEHCVPETAAVEFQFYLDKAQAGGCVIGRHLIQSFSPGDKITPEQAHEIGKKLAYEILGGQYAYVLATHLDRDHIHNHYMWCAVNIETHKRYVSNKASYRKIQEASDRLCAEYGLSVITEKSGRAGKSYTQYQADKYGTSWKTLLRRTIDAAIRSSNDFDGFLSFMLEAGYEIKHGKYISFRATGQERFTRAKTVGDDYTEDRIRERIATKKPMQYFPLVKPETKRVIDRSDPKIQTSPGYRHWATKHNLKASAETLMYLQTNFDADLEAFERKYAELTARRAAMQMECDKACQRIAANNNSVLETVRLINAQKSRTAKEISALTTEIAEMDRVRTNVITTHGEGFYDKHSRRREMAI